MRQFVRLALYASSAALVISLTGCEPCDEAPGSLCRIAGTGNTAFNGDGRAPRDTDLYQVSAAKRGPDGLLYLMDFNNHRLRRVRDEKVETFVGTGQHAFAIPGEAPTRSPLENPVDFAFAPDGALHLVMLHDPRVVRVADDVVEIVAGTEQLGDSGDGGPALEARFSQLSGIAFARDGSIFVADEISHRVRVIRPDRTVHEFAGTGAPGYSGDGGAAAAAQLDSPRGLVVAEDGSVYVADAGNHRVRRISLDGIISTVAGSGVAGFSGDGTEATGAQLRRPQGVTVGPGGALYIADTDNHRVRKVEGGVITTVAGTGERGREGEGGPATQAQLAGPFGLSFDGDVLLISELRNSTVSVVYPSTL